MVWTSDDLVSAVRRRAQLPDSTADGAISDADILELANEEIALRLVPLVRRAREDYFVAYADQTIVSGTARYRVPERAQASGLRDVTIVDPNGNEFSVPRVSIEEMGEIEGSGVTFGPRGVVFVMEGPEVVLLPTPTQSGYTLRLRYHRAHSQLVPVSDTERVGRSGANLVSLSSENTEWVALLAALTYTTMDLIYEKPPFGTYFEDNELITISVDTPAPGTTTYTVSDTPPASFPDDGNNTLAYLALAGETPIVSLPRECWPLLVSAVTSRVLEVVGDRDAAQVAFALYEREEGNVIELLTPRVEGARKRVIDHFSAFRRGRR